MRIGLIGAGHIGGTLARLFVGPVTRWPSVTARSGLSPASSGSWVIAPAPSRPRKRPSSARRWLLLPSVAMRSRARLCRKDRHRH